MDMKFENFKKIIGIGVASGIALNANAKTENSAEKEFTSNKNKIENLNKEVNEDPGGERKVKEVPQGYVKSHTVGNKTYYKKVTEGKKLELAKPGNGKESAEYKSWLINMLKNGTSPEELAKMKYISPEAMAEYQQYYQPATVDIVYVEQEKSQVENPFSAYSEIGEMMYNTDKHAAAEMFVATRDTKSITDPGNLNTSDSRSDVLIRFRNDFGFTGEYIVIPLSEVQKYFGTGKEFQSQELFNELKSRARDFSKTANFTDFANTSK